MKRRDYVRAIYKQTMLNDILFSMAGEEFTDEERAELEEELRKLQEEQAKLEEEKEELEEEPDIEPESVPEEPETPEETPDEPEEEEEIPEEEKIEMPGSPELGQLTWTTTETGAPGILKKYSPGAVLAKECPVCHYQNRPIYRTECENCAEVYRRLRKHIAIKKRQNKNYTPEMAFQELGPKYKYIGPRALREIYETKGETRIDEINEIPSTPRKQLEDILWYRLNVKRNPRTGEPVLDKRGKPIPLENKKYFSTAEMTEALHISPEKLRSMVADYNAKILANLPEEAQKFVKTDENGDILPSSARQLSRYGFIAPTVVMGTGMADVRRRVTKEQEEKLSPEQIEGLKGPAFKSVDIAAWNWDKLKPVFGWDEEAGQFTHGWMKFLREKFLPAVRRHKIESKIGALQRVINLYEKIAQSQREDIKNLWNDSKNKGLRTFTYFYYHPEIDIEEFKKEWKDEYEKYKADHWKVVQKRKIDQGVPGDVKQMLKNYDERKEVLTPEQHEAIVKGLADRLNVPEEQIEQHLETRDEANELLYEKPPEIDYMMFLEANPETTRESLKKKYNRRRKAFEKFIWAKKEDAAKQFDAKADRLKEKLAELEEELKEAFLPEDFDLAEEVRKFHAEETPDPDPDVNKDIEEALKEVKKESPMPSPEEMERPAPEEKPKKSRKKKSQIIEYVLKLADNGQLGLFDDEEEEEKEEELPELPDEETWGRRETPFEEKPGTKYKREIAWLNESTNRIEYSKGTFTWYGTKSLEDELANALGKYQFGIHPDDSIFVTLTDQFGVKKIYEFQVDEEGQGPIVFKGNVTEITLQPELEREPEPEPKLEQEEKAKEAPVEDFGKVKGKYFVYFEWNPDYSGQPNSYKSFFSHTPGKRDFEDLLKAKIEKRFGPKIVPLMHSDDPDHPDKTTKKYVHVTVIEPETERRRRFGAVINRATGDLTWHGTGGVVERKEKERRLNLEKYKNLKSEINLGLTKLEDVELVGDDDLRIVEKTEKDIKKQKQWSAISEEERERIRKVREERKKKLESLTPEEREAIEQAKEETKLTFVPREPEFKEPSGKTEAAPIRKVVIRHGFMKKTIEKPIIDPATGSPKQTPTGKVIKEPKVVTLPKTDAFLVTVRLDSNGKPASAKCESIGVGLRDTGELINVKKYPDIFKAVRTIIDRKSPNLRKERLWDERKQLIEKEYERGVKMIHGEKADPWTKIREKEPHLPAESVDLNAKPYEKCPQASAPFVKGKVCDEILAAVNSITGGPIPEAYQVTDWEEMKRKSRKETSKEIQERRRRHNVTEFHAEDK